MFKKIRSARPQAARKPRRTVVRYVEVFEQRERRWRTFSTFSCGFPARFALPGGCATRFAQTVLAVDPESAALLGHAKGGQKP